ncbi:MAG: 30S ribosomal protein S1 [Acidobacteria bacterium]|nr:30S ribosomal protein S1 [Acidobacteriota bacterium]
MATRPDYRMPGAPSTSPDLPSAVPETDPDFTDFAAAMAAEEAALAAGGDFEHQLEDAEQAHLAGDGEVLRGEVLKVNPKEVIVDVGQKSEGVVPIEQLTGPDGQVTVQKGDVIEVMVERGGLTPEGFLVLSHKRARAARAWDTLEQAERDHTVIIGRVVSRTRGGVLVDVGAEAFMPTSHLDVRPVHSVDPWLGQEIPVRVIKINRRRGNLVVSRRLAVEEEYNARKAAALEVLAEGAVVTGVVKNLTDYGAFVDLGGIDGLLHVSDISHGRVGHPSELLNPGESITVKVLKYDREKQRISLGIKQLAPDPWDSIHERYPLGDRIIGRVVSITDYGAFVEIEAGVEGLIHISEMTWSRRLKHPSKVVRVNDQVEAVVLEIKPQERRVSLGIKQLEADPWTTVAERYSIGSVVEGRVRKLTDFGAFIEIEEGIDGLVHISDFSWTKRIKHPSEIVRKGQQVQAVILGIDTDGRRLSLGVKQLQPDAWESFFHEHMVNDIVVGRVKRAAQFGVFVELLPGVEGLCHNSEIPGAGDRRQTGDMPLELGSEYSFKIIRMSENEKRIGLSLAAAADEQERARLRGYQREAAAATSGMDQAFHSTPGLDDGEGQ